jgi:hypothetical protein
MSDARTALLDRIRAERERQFHLPGSEWDAHHSANDWIAISAHYLHEEVRRAHAVPGRVDFEDSLIKAAAVILAALEHADKMVERKHLT